MNQNKYLKIIKNINIIDELKKRNISGKIINKNYMCNCPLGSHIDKNPSWGIRLNTELKYGKKILKGISNCYSCGSSGDFFQLISILDNITYKEAVSKFSDGVHSNFRFEDIKSRPIGQKLMNKKKHKKIKTLKKSFLKKFVSIFDPEAKEFLNYMRKRGFKKSTLEESNIMVCINEEEYKWFNRVIFPVYIENKKLISCFGRYIYKDEYKLKIRNVKNSDMRNFVYGIPYLKKEYGNTIVIVESATDAMWLRQFKINSVATMTLSINSEKIKHILKYTTDIILCWDGNWKYKLKKNIWKSYVNRLNKSFNVKKIIDLPVEKDPNDLNESEVEKYIKKYY